MSKGSDSNIQPKDILEIFISHPEPAFVPSEIADKLNVTTEGARYQLNKLVDMGYLERKKPSSRVVFYWITPEGHEYYSKEGYGASS